MALDLVSFFLLFPRLFYDMSFSWLRMVVALVISILFSWAIGITAARTKRGEKIIIPLLDIFQSIPILGFFPLVLILFVSLIHGQLGVQVAVVFLIFTSMAWNIAFSVYEAIKSIPAEYLRLATLEKMGFFKRLTILYIPSTWTKVAYNSIISWAVALFYLVSSEIFTLGNSSTHVNNGIGVDIANFASSGEWVGYLAAVLTLIIVDLLTWSLILDQFARWSERYKISYDPQQIRKNKVYRFYSMLSGIFITRLAFELGKGRNKAKYVFPYTKLIQRISKTSLSIVLPSIVLFISWKFLPTSIPVSSIVPNLVNALPSLIKDESQVVIALSFSFIRVWASYGIAVAISLPLGIYVALNNRAYSFMSPALQVVASVPAPVLLPPIALFMAVVPGGDEINALIVITIGMMWYIIFNVMEGVRSIPNEVRQVSTLLELKGSRAWKNVYIPAAMPAFVTGSITAVGGAWNALIVAEYFSLSFSKNPNVITQVPDGIGKLLDIATANGDITLLFLGVASMTALIVVFNTFVWKKLYSYTTKRYAQYTAR